MKRNLSTSLRSILALSIVLVSPGIAAAQSVGGSIEAAASVGAASAAAPVFFGGAVRIGAISAPLAPALAAPISALSARSAPSAEPSAAPSAAAAAAPAEAAEAAASQAAPEAAAAAAAPSPAADNEPANEAPALRADPAERIAGPVNGARAATSADARIGSFSHLRGLFDGWRSRGAAPQDAAQVSETAAVSAAPSGLSRATPRASAAASVPAPLKALQNASRPFGLAVTARVVLHWLAPSRFASLPPFPFHVAAIAPYISAMHPAVALSAALFGGVGALKSARKSGASTGAALRSAAGGALKGAAVAHVVLDTAQLAFNGFSIIGFNPLLTAAAAVVLAHSAAAALSDPALTPGARIRRVLPAAAGALLLAVQSVMIFSVASTPQFVAALALAVGAAVAIAQAARNRADKRAARLTSAGMILSALGLSAAVAFYAPVLLWWFVAAGGVGLLLVLSGLIRTLRTAHAAAPLEAALAATPAPAQAAAPVETAAPIETPAPVAAAAVAPSAPPQGLTPASKRVRGRRKPKAAKS